MGLDNISFYQDSRGYSDVEEFIKGNTDAPKGDVSKAQRYVGLLDKYGVPQNSNIMKKLKNTDDIWELRPNKYRVMFFTISGGKYVILSYFQKKSNKTPPIEIERAEARKRDWLNRNKE